MKVELTPSEARVIGSLIEKQITTPDQYPLSLNALTNACNQKSNRDPVLSLEESEVQRTLDALQRKHYVIERAGFGSRVGKYQHCFCNTEFGSLRFSPLELAIVCELLLRGPQTPGELRTRAARMASVGDAAALETALQDLAMRADGPLVVRLPRETGRRDSRYAHLFYAGDDNAAATAAVAAAPTQEPVRVDEAAARPRIENVEFKIAHLERGLQELSDVVARQQQELDRVLGAHQRLAAQVDALPRDAADAAERVEIPPHY